MVIPENNLLCKVINGEKVLAASYSQIDTFVQCPYKWYKTYVEGNRSTEKHEATSYGTVIHQTMEYFFKNGCRPSYEDMSKAFNYYADIEKIPFDSVKSQIESMQHAARLIRWIVGLFEKDAAGNYKKSWSDLTPMEKVIRGSRPAGVEEDFVLPYKLPKPLTLDGVTYDKVHIIGSVDWRGEYKTKDRIAMYTIDWKSGRKLFDKDKLLHNLQHPIYAFYILRKYKVLPDMCSYFFTRMLDNQNVKVDKEKVERSVKELNDILLDMYDFETNKINSYQAHVWDDAKQGYKYEKRYLMGRQPACLEPRPKPLCFWCDFSIHKQNTCRYSSDWDESKRKNKKD